MNRILSFSVIRQIQRLREDGIAVTLVQGATAAFVIRAIRTVLTFGLHAFLARLLGVEVYGQYAYILNWIDTLAVFGQAGFDTGSLRFVAAYRGQRKWRLLRGFIERTSQISIGISLLIATASAGIVWHLKEHLQIGLVQAFWVGLIVLPIMVLLQISSVQLRALKRVVFSQLPQTILHPVGLAAGVFIAVEILGYHPKASMVLGLELAILLVVLLLIRRLLLSCLPGEVFVNSAEYQTNGWIKVALSLLFISAFNLVLARADIITLGIFRGTTEAGIYAVVSRIASIIPFSLIAVNTIAVPVISELFAQRQMTELQRIVTLAARGIFVLSLPVALGMVIWGKFILGLFGPAFVKGYFALAILTGGQLINALMGPVGFLMTMTGHHNQAAKVLGVSSLLNILFNVLLTPVYGMIGAAVATAATTILWNVTMFIFVQKRLGINSSMLHLRSQHL
jgi:O-antigen/teichoic acid export membrane protein